MPKKQPKCPRCRGDGYYFRVRDGANPFNMSIFTLARNMRVECACPAGDAERRRLDAYNQNVADKTAALTT